MLAYSRLTIECESLSIRFLSKSPYTKKYEEDKSIEGNNISFGYFQMVQFN